MNQKELSELTNEELLQEAKKIKSGNIFDAVLIGFLIGVAVYSSFKNGFGLLTFLPLIYLSIAAKNRTKNFFRLKTRVPALPHFGFLKRGF